MSIARFSLKRPENWATIGWDPNLAVFTLAMTASSIPPAVGFMEYTFSMQFSDMIELRDALTKALKQAGFEK